LYLGKSRTVR